LHFGSLVAAVGSYLDAKYHHGTWLVRMEDLDAPRCVPGAADDILRTLEIFGLHSDEPVIYQSQRTAAYEAALMSLRDYGAVYPCRCTRKEVADSAVQGIEGFVYPGTCREKGSALSPDRTLIDGSGESRHVAWRVRTDLHLPPRRGKVGMGVDTASDGVKGSTHTLALPLQGGGEMGFADALQGHITQNLEQEIGDFVVKRADGLFAYQLAVVVDDAFQDITHVVRGADLLASTPRQIGLQRLLGLSTPAYMHLPVAVNAAGEKLSKQTLAAPVDGRDAAGSLWRALVFLRQEPPPELARDQPELLAWAVRNWQPEKLRGLKALPALA
jgi:glutamyl-Q tRNA(Asp) synthetase